MTRTATGPSTARTDPSAAEPSPVVLAGEAGPRARIVELLRQLGWFIGAGLACSGAQAAIYLVLRRGSSPAVAGLVALVVTTVLNTEAHRRLTFPASRTGAPRAHLEAGSTAAAVYAVSLVALPIVETLGTDLTPVREAIVIASVTGTVGLLRFTVLREWVFANRRRPRRT